MVVTSSGRRVGACVLSVNLGRATAFDFMRRATGIDKRPVGHAVMVTAPGPKHVAGSGLAGDDVCDRRHHGGNDQAVYAYAREDLDDWAGQLGQPLANGSFGENLTTSGIDISNAVIGERWRVGSTLVLELSDPRIPCRTFADFLAERGWVKRFVDRAAPGTYLRVIQPGIVSAGDEIHLERRPEHGVTVATAFRAFTSSPHLLSELDVVDALSPEAKETVHRRTAMVLDTPAP